MTCIYATETTRKWNGNPRQACTVVECRNPQLLKQPELWYRHDGMRFPVDEHYNLTGETGMFEVRSIYCNTNCPLWTERK